MFILFFVLCSMFHVSWALAQVRLETGLPNIPGGQLPTGQELPQYIRYLFIFGLGLITVLAFGQMTLGGIYYILAAGNSALATDAKDRIFQALIGLGVILISYLSLRIINPDLVSLRNPGLERKQFNLPENIITGDKAKNATYNDYVNAPDGTTYNFGGANITKVDKNTIVDCNLEVCVTWKISDLEKMPTWSPWQKLGELIKKANTGQVAP